MSTALGAGAVYFAVTFAVAFVLGAVRQLVLVPRLGAVAAVLIELPLILLVSWIAAGAIVRRFRVSGATPARLAMGGLAFVLLQAVEVALAVTFFGMPAQDYVRALLTVHGLLGLAGQIAFGLLPLVVARDVARQP